MPDSPTVPHAPRAFLFPKMEEEIAAYWHKERIFERTLAERPEKKTFVFYDGPPFATGLPHYGHLLQSAVKDAVARYWTMRGYRVPRVWGWDCHGLPIENLIEKELNLGSKKAIEDHGIDKFNAACRATVFTYEHEWGKYVERIGRWVDFEHSYKTMDTDYIESVWWVFAELHKKGLVYKDRRVSLYCPRCSTPLSNFEIAMGNSYVEREDPAVYVKFPVIGKDQTFFLAWTTTPWSLPSNTGLSVHPDLNYVAARVPSGETYIFAEARMGNVLQGIEGAEIVNTWKGSELLGLRYEPLFIQTTPLLIKERGTGGEAPFRVVAGTHVSAEDGTGIVHTAPAFGEEDLQMAREHGLPIVDLVDEEGRMVEGSGPWAGLPIKEADAPIVADLAARGLLFRSERITHSVPICWRCNTLLFYKAQTAWFVDIVKLKPTMLKTAKKIHWHPEHFKDGRFGKGLETAPDWNISRTRYWGSPIPVWECSSCDQRTVIGSLKELEQKRVGQASRMKPADLDLHRPAIDEVAFACACGGVQRRISEVFDCWFESGSMPVASIHYPFERKAWFDAHAPADFIGEAQDQTRGWFYTLHVLSSALFERPAFTHAIVTGLMLAEDGKKMSKKLKNYPDPWDVLTKYGADALRYYFFSSPIVEADSLNFSERDLDNVVRGFLNLVWNINAFYQTYAAGQTNQVRSTKPRSMHVLDRWLFARLEQLIQAMTLAMDGYQLSVAARPLRDFVDDLSTWWLRRSRERMKSSDADERLDALRTLREALESLSVLLAPFTPFIAERIYQDIGGLKSSVHLEKWPVGDPRRLDEGLLEDMRWVREIASSAHELRAQAKIPVRQALASVSVRLNDAAAVRRRQSQTDVLHLLCDELNVEAVRLQSDPSVTPDTMVSLDTALTPELKRKGLRREFARQAMNMRKTAGLQAADRIRVTYQAPDELHHAIVEGRADLLRDLRADQLERSERALDTGRLKETLKIGEYEVTIVIE